MGENKALTFKKARLKFLHLFLYMYVLEEMDYKRRLAYLTFSLFFSFSL